MTDGQDIVVRLREQIESEDEFCQFGGDGFGGGNIFREAATAIEQLRAELAGLDAEIAAWLLSQKAVPIIHADDRIVANIATAIAAKAYRKDDGDE